MGYLAQSQAPSSCLPGGQKALDFFDVMLPITIKQVSSDLRLGLFRTRETIAISFVTPWTQRSVLLGFN